MRKINAKAERCENRSSGVVQLALGPLAPLPEPICFPRGDLAGAGYRRLDGGAVPRATLRSLLR